MAKLRAAVLLILLSPWATAAMAADVEGRLVRRNVFTDTVEGAPRVAVTLSSPQLGRSVLSYSSSSGRYRFRNIAPGTYKLEIWPSGFARESGNTDLITCSFEVSGNRTVIPDLQMRNRGLKSNAPTRKCADGIGHWFG